MAEETKNQGQQEYAENISGQAKEIISAALEETKNNGTSPVLGDPNVTDNFKGLPMRELIAAPLIAAAEAQQELAATAWNFYQKIAFDEDGKTARVLEFDIKRPIQQPKLNRNWQRQHGISTSKLHLMVKAAIKRVYWNSMSKDRYSRMEK